MHQFNNAECLLHARYHVYLAIRKRDKQGQMFKFGWSQVGGSDRGRRYTCTSVIYSLWLMDGTYEKQTLIPEGLIVGLVCISFKENDGWYVLKDYFIIVHQDYEKRRRPFQPNKIASAKAQCFGKVYIYFI